MPLSARKINKRETHEILDKDIIPDLSMHGSIKAK